MSLPHYETQCHWSVSVYYAEALVDTSIQLAWPAVLNFQMWNPSFKDAEVIPVSGTASTEGEVVRITKKIKDVRGEPLPEFYVKTVKLVQHRHIVWYVFPEAGNDFRIFFDIALSEVDGGVRFSVNYYEQNLFTGKLLESHRTNRALTLQALADAFKGYCESGTCQ